MMMMMLVNDRRFGLDTRVYIGFFFSLVAFMGGGKEREEGSMRKEMSERKNRAKLATQ
jgi:hypothetical protein